MGIDSNRLEARSMVLGACGLIHLDLNASEGETPIVFIPENL